MGENGLCQEILLRLWAFHVEIEAATLVSRIATSRSDSFSSPRVLPLVVRRVLDLDVYIALEMLLPSSLVICASRERSMVSSAIWTLVSDLARFGMKLTSGAVRCCFQTVDISPLLGGWCFVIIFSAVFKTEMQSGPSISD
jgi:hypothetical protein